jgi:predicted DNA-binding protein
MTGRGRPRAYPGRETVVIGLRIPRELEQSIRAAATERGVTKSTVLRDVMRAGWAQYRKEQR